MGDFNAPPPEPDAHDNDATAARNSKAGLLLFFVYTSCYSAFVLISTFSPETFDSTPLAGVNLAILSGFGLIVLALLLALVYMWICRRPVATHDEKESRS